MLELFIGVADWVANHFDFPAFMLMIATAGFVWMLWTIQKRPDFDLGQMLIDENGKASSARLAVFVCLGISSWSIMYMLVKTQGTIDHTIFLGYVAIWSGAKVVEKAIDAYAGRGKLPDPTLQSSDNKEQQ